MIVRIADDEEPIEAPPGRDPWGLHCKDEVWDGVYIVMPIADLEHQKIVGGLSASFWFSISQSGLGEVFPGGNFSDRARGWTKNYRIPDVCVVLRDSHAINMDTHFQGGPDFAVEVLSDDDHAREKLPFYAANGVQELLIVDRDPWALELYRLDQGSLNLVAISTTDAPDLLASAVLPLAFRLIPGDPRPTIEVIHSDGIQRWTV